MMKRLLVFMTLLICCCTTLAGALAQNDEGSLSAPLQDIAGSVISAAFSNGEMYTLSTDQGLSVYDPLSDTLTEIANIAAIDVLIGGDALGFIEWHTGTVSMRKGDRIESVGQIDYAALNEEAVYIWKAVFSGNDVLFLYNRASDLWSEKHIGRLALDTGITSILPIQHALELSAYKDDGIIVIASNPLTPYEPAAPAIFDIAAGQITQTLPALTTLSGGAVAYDSIHDQIYACDAGQVVLLQNEQWETVNYYPQYDMLGSHFAGLFASGDYAVLTQSGLTLRTTDPSLMTDVQPIVVRGTGLHRDIIAEFMQMHPEIPLILDERYIANADDFITEIQSKGSSVDVFLMPDSTGVWNLIEKGFAQDLTPYENVTGIISKMYPTIQETITIDEKYYALPISFSLQPWTVHEELLEEAGLTMPATLAEYFSMLLAFEEDMADDFDFGFQTGVYTSYGLPKYECMKTLVDQYIVEYEQPEQPVSFDTEPFRSMLRMIDALPYGDEDVDAALVSPDAQSWLEPAKTIFSWDSFNILQIGVAAKVPPTLIPIPPYEEGNPPRVLASTILAIINPFSISKENAAFFLAFIAEHQSPEGKVTLFPDQNDAIPFLPMVHAIEQLVQERDKLVELRLAVDQAHSAELEDSINGLNASIAEMEQNKYYVKAESIAKYRAVEQYMYIPTQSLFFSQTMETRDSFYAILKKYVAGGVTDDQLISELDRMMRMVFLEQ